MAGDGRDGERRVTGPEHVAVVAAGLGAGVLTSTVGVASLLSFPVLIALGICLVATLLPSWWAARLLPAEGVRYE